MEKSARVSSEPERWALLIGINHYLDGALRPVKPKPLKGCVRDIERVAAYLKGRGVPPGNIKELTASEGAHGTIKEAESDWPTHDNVMKQLDCISGRAKRGALVYIHYSGHGILRKDIKKDPPRDDGNSLHGAALVPTDVRRGGAYISAYQLGAKIKQMTEHPEKQFRVTLVLDCCHSGQGIRGDDSDFEDEDDKYTSVRGIEEGDVSILDSDKVANKEADRLMDTERGMEEHPVSWLEKPTSCTILTACDVEEKAREDYFIEGSSEMSGVLTHWIFKILERFPSAKPPSYSTIHAQVMSQIIAWRPMRKRKQNPGIFGDALHEFFGASTASWDSSHRVFSRSMPSGEDEFFVEVGSAQGVAFGATYKFPPDGRAVVADPSNDASHPKGRPIMLRVSDVYDLRSRVRPVLDQDIPSVKDLVEGGYRAVLHEWALPCKTVIKIVGTSEFEPDASFLADLKALLGDDIEAMHNLVLNTSTLEPTGREDFRLAVNKKKVARIQYGNGMPLPWLPAISLRRRNGAKEYLLRLLKHIARFQAIKELRYGEPGPDNQLSRERFELVAKDQTGVLLPSPKAGYYEARKDQEVRVQFLIKDDGNPVYVFLFHLSDQFGVVRRWPKLGEEPHQLYKSEENAFIRGKMKIPVGRDEHQAEVTDTFRAYVFTGSRRPSWDDLALEEISSESPLPIGDEEDSDDEDRGFDEDESFSEDGKWTVLDCTIITTK